MTIINVTVTHTIDPAAVEMLRGLLRPGAHASVTGPAAPADKPAPGTPAAPVAPAATPVAPVQAAAPVAPVAPAAAPVAPVQAAAPVVQVAPTAAPTYTVDQLAQAAALLADTSDQARAAVLALIRQHGAQTIMEIKPDQYAAFAAGLRALGAKV